MIPEFDLLNRPLWKRYELPTNVEETEFRTYWEFQLGISEEEGVDDILNAIVEQNEDGMTYSAYLLLNGMDVSSRSQLPSLEAAKEKALKMLQRRLDAWQQRIIVGLTHASVAQHPEAAQ